MIPLYILRITVTFALLITSVTGKCTNPRVRKEWRSITANERACWIDAVKCLANLPHNPKVVATVDPAVTLIPPMTTNSSYYDDWVYVHMDLNPSIHGTGYFLPWHRLYVQKFEDALRSKCGYTGVHPYWDWTMDTADFYNATIFCDSPHDGLGRWGDPNDDFQICTGGLKDICLAYPAPHRIRREFTNHILPSFPLPPGVPPVDPNLMLNTTFTKEVVNTMLNLTPGDFNLFQSTVGGLLGPHPGPHLILGGDMGGTCPRGLGPPVCIIGPKWSPNDPMFFLHHAMIDKVWYDWQHRDPRNKDVFGGGSISWQYNASLTVAEYPVGGPPWLDTSSVIPGDGLWNNIMVKDVMDTVDGKLCYVYE